MKLNERQLEAVNTTEGAIAVFACAGSGKTRVITNRIAHLIKDLGVAPSSILACTFTNKAAGEMKSRVEEMLGQQLGGLWIGTFHSICLRILRKEAHHIGIDPRFTVVDEEDSLDLIKGIMRDLSVDVKQISPYIVKSAISAAKNSLVDPSSYQASAMLPKTRTIGQIYKMYQDRLSEMNSFDFDDLILKTIDLLTDYTEIAKRYYDTFVYVLVDEYQDINAAQHKLVKLFARRGNIMIVGDDDQSIYAFRGATPYIMLQFADDFPGAKIINLELNYRSTQNILGTASQLVSANQKRHPKEIKASIGNGDPVKVFTGIEPSDEAIYIVEKIRELNSKGRPYSDFAVLYRTNAQSRSFEEIFMANGIPYHLVGGIRFYQRKEIKDLLSYLKIVLNPSDSQSFKRAIQNPRRGIGPALITRIELSAKSLKATMEDALASMMDQGEVTGHVGGSASNFVKLVRELREMANLNPAHEVIKYLIDGINIIETLKNEGTEDSQARAENVEEFLNLSYEFGKTSEDSSLEAFLGTVALMSDMDNVEEGEQRVIMTTIHQAKGLEFPVVFLCGLEEGTFPHLRSLDDQESIEEERRLAYVGMTRAKEALFLTRVINRQLWGGTRLCEESRFLKEIACPEIVYEGIKKQTQTAREQQRSFVKKSAQVIITPKKEPVKVSAGEVVVHQAWGDGTVLNVSGDNAEVDFLSVGRKLLNLRYAPIKSKGA